MNSPAEPGGIVSRAIILNAKLSVHARLLYAVLCCVADDRREIERSKPELIDDSGLSRATLHRAMAELIEAGIVEVHSSVNSDGGTRTNLYRLQEGGLTQRLPPVQAETPGVSHRDPLQVSAAQTPVSQGDPGGSQEETGEGVSEGDGGLIYKKDRYSSSKNTLSSTPTNITKEEHIAKPPDPAPEEAPVALLNLNDFEDLPSAEIKPRRQRTSPTTDDPDFDKAWAAYGHKVDRVQARKAWGRALKKTSAETILAAIPAYVAATTGRGEPEGTGTAWKPRRKNLATWLNNEGWTEEVEPPKQGYQGHAGSDVKTQEGAIDRAKVRPICKLMRSGPMGADWEMNFAWYYHWNVRKQRHWTVEQMLETGNTPEDVDALMDAYANGIDPQLYQRLLDDYNIPPHGSDDR